MAIPYSGFGGHAADDADPGADRHALDVDDAELSDRAGASRTFNFSALGWTQGIVQFGHHSYTPLKDCASTPELHLPTGHVALGQHQDQPGQAVLPATGDARSGSRWSRDSSGDGP